jgi:hypothetical protein
MMISLRQTSCWFIRKIFYQEKMALLPSLSWTARYDIFSLDAKPLFVSDVNFLRQKQFGRLTKLKCVVKEGKSKWNVYAANWLLAAKVHEVINPNRLVATVAGRVINGGHNLHRDFHLCSDTPSWIILPYCWCNITAFIWTYSSYHARSDTWVQHCLKYFEFSVN